MFETDGLVGGQVKAGRGRKPTITDDQVGEIVTTTTTAVGHAHRSCRTIAARVGVSSGSVQWMWSELGLKAHRVDTFKVSNDRRFEEKLIDVVGLYLIPVTFFLAWMSRLLVIGFGMTYCPCR
ncbi:MAG: hypothetical protein ACK5MT_17795 [Actinomycetales bacterium]